MTPTDKEIIEKFRGYWQGKEIPTLEGVQEIALEALQKVRKRAYNEGYEAGLQQVREAN